MALNARLLCIIGAGVFGVTLLFYVLSNALPSWYVTDILISLIQCSKDLVDRQETIILRVRPRIIRLTETSYIAS